MAPDLREQIVDAAARRGVSVSAWITDAARLALKVQDGLAAVAEWETELGAFTEAELKAARKEPGVAPPPSTCDCPATFRMSSVVYDARRSR